MFVRIEDKVINLSLVEQIIFAKNTVVVCFNSKESLFIDLKHADKLEHAIIHFNEQGGYARP